MATIEQKEEINKIHYLAIEWKLTDKWNDEAGPVCSWEGISCNNDNYITIINVSNRGLKGSTIPSVLGEFRFLTDLILRENEFEDEYPESILQNLDYLQVLDISNNKMQGTLSTKNIVSDSLKLLDVRNNNFQGRIPSNIGSQFPNLDKLLLSHNQFTGIIPEESISELLNSQLTILDLSDNSLDGTIPHFLIPEQEEQVIQGIFFQNNNLIGTIPPFLSRLSSLRQIYLENNMLSGTIPASLADLPNLKELYIDGNKLTGTVPHDICQRQLNELFFKDSTLIENDCERVACPMNTVSETGVFPCTSCNEGYFSPYLGINYKCMALVQKRILDEMFDSMGGLYWKSSSGWGLENVHPCAYEGVSCNSASQVTNITLVNHGLSGAIPSQLGFLQHLQVLNLADNTITGYLPSDLRFAPLEVLDISGNLIRGQVPPLLCTAGDINGNGKIQVRDKNEKSFQTITYECNVIACPVGSFSPIGFSVLEMPCLPCPSNEFLAMKYCQGSSSSLFGQWVKGTNSDYASTTRGFISVFLISGLALILTIVFHPYKGISGNANDHDNADGDFDLDDYDDDEYEYIAREEHDANPLLTTTGTTLNLGSADDAVHPLSDVVIEVPQQHPHQQRLESSSIWSTARDKDDEDWLKFS